MGIEAKLPASMYLEIDGHAGRRATVLPIRFENASLAVQDTEVFAALLGDRPVCRDLCALELVIKRTRDFNSEVAVDLDGDLGKRAKVWVALKESKLSVALRVRLRRLAYKFLHFFKALVGQGFHRVERLRPEPVRSNNHWHDQAVLRDDNVLMEGLIDAASRDHFGSVDPADWRVHTDIDVAGSSRRKQEFKINDDSCERRCEDRF